MFHSLKETGSTGTNFCFNVTTLKFKFGLHRREGAAEISRFALRWVSADFAQAFAGLKVTFPLSVHVKIFYNLFFHSVL